MSDTQAAAGEASRFAEVDTQQFIETSRQALGVTFGMQRMMLNEMAKASDEIFDRVRAEIEIASEFIARLATAHSVKEIATACNDCGQHQAEAFRQDSELLLRHSQRFYEEASRVLAPAPSRIN